MAATERTYLTRPNDPPHYVEFSGLLRTRRNKIRQFQCCVCAFIISLFVMTLVITISYSISKSAANNFTTSENLTTQNLQSILLKSTGLDPNSDSSDPHPSPLTEEETIEGIQAGNEAIKNRQISDASTKPLPSPSPDFRHQSAVSTSLQAGELALAGVAEIAATQKIENSRSLQGKPSSMGSYFNGGWAPQGSCKEFTKITCNRSKYRTFDGTCNNPNQWGSAMSPYRRMLPPAYADGINSPRRAVSGEPLPSAREVSLKVHPPSPSSNPSFTVMLAVFGQFLDHDITATAISQGTNGTSLSCCSPVSNHPECFPVKVGHGDPVFDVGGMSCMEFVRSAPAPQCKIGPRQQMNQVTAFIDGSTIYGSDLSTANSLRDFQGGRLRMQLTPDNRTLLPRSLGKDDGCNRKLELKRGRYCFAAGDGRANENLHLTTMHVLWARQHNKLADELSRLNPQWDDETLYQEARRIVGAQLQHIAYNEFIPIVLGETVTKARNLRPLKSGFRKVNNTVNPELANNFAAAAFRFAHTLLPGLMKVTDAQKGTTSYVELHRMLFNPYSLYSQGGVAESIVSATSNVIQKTSTHVTSQLTRHLFEDPSSNKTVPCGLDLVSLNVQRGRDHGLPGYTKWREYCGLKKPKNFLDLKDDLDPDALDAISKLYSSVDDVDLYTGALGEVAKSDGIVGPTFTCLIGQQFERSQQGDSFWFENSDEPGSFTEEQLKELRKTSLAKLICDCSDGITQIQYHVMRSEKFDNSKISCEDIPGPSLEAWKEAPNLTAEEPVSEEPTAEKPNNDWLAFKDDINKTVQNILDFIKDNQPLISSPDYLSVQKEVNESFANLRKELAGLHPRILPPASNSLDDLKIFMNNSLEEAENQVSLIEKNPSVVDDWVIFKKSIFKSLNDSIDNLKKSSPTSEEWLVFGSKIKSEVMNIKDQVADMKGQIAAMKNNSTLQVVIANEEDDWEDLKVDIIKSVHEIVDKIRENMPPPGDPKWKAFVQNIKDQFSNFKNGLLNGGPVLQSTSGSVSHWEKMRRNLVESLDEAIINIDENKPGWADYRNEVRNESTNMDEEDPIDENPEWKKFRTDLNETVEKILEDIESNAPPPGDPSWSGYRMKIMDQFSKFRDDILKKPRVLLNISKDGTVFDWMAFKSDFDKSLGELIAEKKAGKLLPGDPKWAEFRKEFSRSVACAKYRIPVVELGTEKSSSSDWIDFRRDFAEAVKEVVQFFRDNAPPPGSPDWVEFREEIRKKFSDLRKEFDIRKSEILLKASDVDDTKIDEDTNDPETEDKKIDDTKIDDVTPDWDSLKDDLNKELGFLITGRRCRNCSPNGARWEKFRNYVNKSISNFKYRVGNLTPKPRGKHLLQLTNDWTDFSNQINKSLADAVKNIGIDGIMPGDLTWANLKDFIRDNLEKAKEEIEDIKAEWLSKMKEIAEKKEIPNSGNEDLESLQDATNESFSQLKNRVENLEIEPVPFDISGVEWVEFKDSINKTVMDFINRINQKNLNDWAEFRNFVDQSMADLRDQINSLKNVTDEVVDKINKEILEAGDTSSIQAEMNETISNFLGNLSTSDSSVTKMDLGNVRGALMKTRMHILSLTHDQLSKSGSRSTEDWESFSNNLERSVSDVKKKIDDLKPVDEFSKLNEYRISVMNHFRELDEVMRQKKTRLLKMMPSSASDSRFSGRNVWISFISFSALARILKIF